MKKRSIFATLLAGIMTLSMMSVTAFAAEADNEPYDIATKTVTVDSIEDLQWVSDYSRSATNSQIPADFKNWTIKITENIEDVGNWTPITNFHGTMKGESANGGIVTISGLYVSVDTGAGLCGNMTQGGGKFENLKIADSTFISSGDNAGSFVGGGFTSSFTSCEASGVTVSAKRFVGGIVGSCYGDIRECTVTSLPDHKTVISAIGTNNTVLGSGDNAGGIVGLMGEGGMEIYKCTVSGIEIKAVRQAGGIAGVAQYGNTIDNCTVEKTSISASLRTDSPTLAQRTAAVGGIVGQISTNENNTQIIHINQNKVGPEMNISRTTGSTKYCGWVIGDRVRATDSQFEYVGNQYIGTTSLPAVGN